MRCKLQVQKSLMAIICVGADQYQLCIICKYIPAHLLYLYLALPIVHTYPVCY